MNSCVKLIFISILCIILYTSCNQEGFINKPPKDEPYSLQYYACHDSNPISFNGKLYPTLGNNNYKIKNHSVGEPLEGTYSYFLDTYKIRDYDEIFHAPICQNEDYNFKEITSITPPEIFDHSDMRKKDKMLEMEEEYEINSIKDPFYSYVDPMYIGNKITYNDHTIEMFLDTHRSSSEDQFGDMTTTNHLVDKPTQN